MARALINAPAAARAGEVIEIRTLITHPMETGFRPGADGKTLPRDIITRFTCRYSGELVFAAELFSAVAANPFLAFHTVATKSGVILCTWEGDNGFSQSESVSITVIG
ncbi:MAG: thiosulfate oxidation carrier complex protein SoxZ [Herminiimonas sp.]|nr:thiosulfate oxidation carrier complex protein SoxZ [Herminiimonas sp.]